MAYFRGKTTTEITDCLKKFKVECSNDSVLTAKKLIELNCSLTQALLLKDAAIISYMLDCGYNVNERDSCDSTPLHKAIILLHLESVKLLINRGADVDAKSYYFGSPLEKLLARIDLHESKEALEIFKFLLPRSARIPYDKIHLYFMYSANKEVIKTIIQSGVNLMEETWREHNLFYALVSNSAIDPVEILRDQKLDVNWLSPKGYAVLMAAAAVGNANTIEYLLNKGAQVNGTDWQDRTALMLPFISSCRHDKNHVKSIELLLQYGADPQFKTCEHIFYATIEQKKFALIKPYLAHLALLEDLGIKIREEIKACMNFHVMFTNYFNMCKKKLEKIKKTKIYYSMTLFELLTVSEYKMIKYMQNKELHLKLQITLHNNRHTKLYYYNALRIRMRRALRVVNLKRNAYNLICEKVGIDCLAIRKIIDYLSVDDLETMLEL